MKSIFRVVSILAGAVLVLKGIQILVDFLYRRCCNAYIETPCDDQF